MDGINSMNENNSPVRPQFIIMAVGAFVAWRLLRRGGPAKPPKKMKQTVLVGADLSGKDLTNSDWQSALIVGGLFKDTNLSGVNLRKARLQRLDLRGANLTGARLEGARLRGVAFDKTTILPDGSRWSRKVKMTRFTDPTHKEFWAPEADEAETAPVV